MWKKMECINYKINMKLSMEHQTHNIKPKLEKNGASIPYDDIKNNHSFLVFTIFEPCFRVLANLHLVLIWV